MSEHFLIRNARTMDFSPICPLQRTLDNMFIGAIQYMGEHPECYTMAAVSEAVAAHKVAIQIADEREDKAKAERKAAA